MEPSGEIARTILAGFDKHYRLFRQISADAKRRFEEGSWVAVQEAGKARIQMYDRRVVEAVEVINDRFPIARHEESLWPRIKQAYIGALYEHHQPECAETFFNSVACRVLHRRYYRNDYIFWRAAVSTEHLVGKQPTYRIHYGDRGLRAALREALVSFELRNPWQDLERDLDYVERAIAEALPEGQPHLQLQVLSSLFYRNKAAYLVGRALNTDRQFPFLVPILQDGGGRLFLDALLLSRADIGRVFSLARAYFMVDTEVPSATVEFLSSMMPTKPKAELYTMLGLQKQGKTLFYRDLHRHLQHSNDRFVLAPGTKGLVMLVFTLPSFGYVFKVIRDHIAPPKDTDRGEVMKKYLMVKYHDRVGRLADTLEYSHVAFPLERFDPSVIDELRSVAPSTFEIDGEQLVIKHMYIERRMVPLDIYLRGADEAHKREAIGELGNAIRELASANIFPGDLLLKNFGVTRHGRVVFYDYDEIGYLTDYEFRRMPKARSYEDEIASEAWFSVGPRDVFPEELPKFLFADARSRELFYELHGELLDPRFWIERQRKCRAGEQEDVFPYDRAMRFGERYR